MDLEAFKRTPTFKRLQFQRTWYLVKPRDNAQLGISAKWCKQGISRCNLLNRLRCYRTYWPSGIIVLACAAVTQPRNSTIEMLTHVEKKVLAAVTRLNKNTESLPLDQAMTAIDVINKNEHTFSVTILMNKKHSPPPRRRVLILSEEQHA